MINLYENDINNNMVDTDKTDAEGKCVKVVEKKENKI